MSPSPLNWEALARTAWHPVAMQVLEYIAAAPEAASPRDIAETLGLKLGDVSYHTRRLRDSGIIELVRSEQRRGAVKHFYAAAAAMRETG